MNRGRGIGNPATGTDPRPLDWRGGSLRQVLDGLAGHGATPAIVTFADDGERIVSYRELGTWVERATTRLVADGLAGKRIALLAGNSPGWVATCLAIINAGGCAVPLDTKFDERSLRHVLADAEPDLIFVDEESRERVARLAPEGARLLALETETDGPARADETPGDVGELPDCDPEDVAVIFYTSGTTGPPKGVPLNHRNLLFELQSLLSIGLMAAGERLLLPLPLHHVYPFVVGMLTPLAYGVGIVLPQSMTGPHILHAIGAGKVSTVIGVPRLYEALIASLDQRVAGGGAAARLFLRWARRASLFARRRLSLRLGRLLFRPLHRRLGPGLRLMASGGAALDAELAWAMESLGWTVATGYGLTETSPLLTIVPPGDARFETAGKAIPDVELRVVPLAQGADEAEEAPEPVAEPQGSAQIGEIQARGPNVFGGYLNAPERTREAFTVDGWYRTEDRGWIDEDGYLHILGRAATFVVTAAGKNISLEELERVYAGHKAIKEAGLFMQEGRLAAVVVPNPTELRGASGMSIDDMMRDAVRDVSQTLPRYKRIDDIVVSRDALARTRLGKIRRDRLRQRFDSIRAEGEGAGEAGPLPVEEMSGDDQTLLERPEARRVWELLARRYPALRLTPDSDVAMDLGVDSLEWINLTLEIREAAGVELTERATSRIESVRDLLRESAAITGSGDGLAGTLDEDPEGYLTAEQRQWLEPLSPLESALARFIYQLNRFLMRTFFDIKVDGLARLGEAEQVVIAPSHASVLDPFVVAAALPYDVLRRTAFAGWTGIAFANPLYRLFARLGRSLPVQQDRAAFSSLALALVTLRGGGNLIWFPEGRRSPDGRLQSLMPGIGVLLEKHPVRVLPAVIRGTFEAMPIGRRFPRLFRPIEIRFGQARAAAELDETGQGDRPAQRITDGLHRELERLADQR